eukprot:g10688.t1
MNAGVPEVCVPLSYAGDIFSGSTTSSPQPELCVYNCAQLSLDHRLNTAQISCTPPSSPFVLCRIDIELVQCLRHRYANVQAFPVRGYYQVKEVSPVELRLLLQIEFGPELLADKSTFSVTDDASVIIWQIRAGGEMKSASLIGELSVENSGYHSDPYAASAACKQQSVKSKCIPEYCEVFLKIPNATFSGLSIDPKGVTVYPATKLSISIQSEVLAGRYQIWNAADDNIKGHQPLLGDRGGDE